VALGLRLLAPWLARRCRRVHNLLLLPTAPNNEAQVERLVDALDIVALYSPRHLIWLKRCVSTLAIGANSHGKVLWPNLVLGGVVCNPRWLWRSSPDDVALELVFVATLARVSGGTWRGYQLHCAYEDRLQDLAFGEKLGFAARLPDGDRLVEKWRAWDSARSGPTPADA
jgi:hypothetical protein